MHYGLNTIECHLGDVQLHFFNTQCHVHEHYSLLDIPHWLLTVSNTLKGEPCPIHYGLNTKSSSFSFLLRTLDPESVSTPWGTLLVLPSSLVQFMRCIKISTLCCRNLVLFFLANILLLFGFSFCRKGFVFFKTGSPSISDFRLFFYYDYYFALYSSVPTSKDFDISSGFFCNHIWNVFLVSPLVNLTPTFPLSVYYRLDRFGPKGSLTWTGELGNPTLWILLAFHGFILIF